MENLNDANRLCCSNDKKICSMQKCSSHIIQVLGVELHPKKSLED